MPWRTFWVEDTGVDVVALRRYVDSDKAACPGPSSYHNARTFVEQRLRQSREAIPVEQYAGDERWPVSCSCGYVFADDDHWQVWTESIYLRRSTAEHWKTSDLPVGATFNAHWQPENWRNTVDGRAITVVLPHVCPDDLADPRWRRDARACMWNIDGPATGKPGSRKMVPHAWTRTGDPTAEPSTLHAHPSIDAGGCCYHGLLHNGVLSDPL